MSDPYVGEIRMFAGNFAPVNWAFCNGQLLSIAENDTLYTLIGTTYGGDGVVAFALPDLRGRIPLHMGRGNTGTTYLQGQRAGAETVQLSTQEIPEHNHQLMAASSAGYLASPENGLPARHRDYKAFVATGAGMGGTPLHTSSLSATGGNQPHENLPPYMCVSFIISLFGIFPSQN
ncbi:tail fiber protein [Xylophilus sp. GW821-FHT01B05]